MLDQGLIKGLCQLYWYLLIVWSRDTCYYRDNLPNQNKDQITQIWRKYIRSKYYVVRRLIWFIILLAKFEIEFYVNIIRTVYDIYDLLLVCHNTCLIKSLFEAHRYADFLHIQSLWRLTDSYNGDEKNQEFLVNKVIRSKL